LGGCTILITKFSAPLPACPALSGILAGKLENLDIIGMIQPGTTLNVADNTGAKIVKCFNIPGGTKRHYASIGDIVVGTVKKADPRKEVKFHDVVKVVILRQRQPYRREDGSYIRFDENACCILGEGKEPKGSRVFGPIPRELREKGFEKIFTLAKEIV